MTATAGGEEGVGDNSIIVAKFLEYVYRIIKIYLVLLWHCYVPQIQFDLMIFSLLKCTDGSVLVFLKCMDGSVLAHLRFPMQSPPTRFPRYNIYYARKALKCPI